MSSANIPPGYSERLYAPGLAEAVELLRIIAGSPMVTERAQLLIDAVAVTDAAAVQVDAAQDISKVYSVMVLRFTQGSGAGRYDITGGIPTQTRGVQIPSGGGELTIRNAENIRRFRVIGEAGAVLNFSGFLFNAPAFTNVQQ